MAQILPFSSAPRRSSPSHLPEVEPVITLNPRPLPKRDRDWVQDAIMTIVLLLLLASALSLLSGCSARAAEPLPDVRPTLARLDRIHDALIPAQTQRCLVHAGGRCL